MPFDLNTSKRKVTKKFTREIILNEIEALVKAIDEEEEQNHKYNQYYNYFTQKVVVDYFQKYIKALTKIPKNIRICSLCEENNHQVLWSMYANQFKGACIEYEITNQDVKKVIYGKRSNYDPILKLMKCLYGKDIKYIRNKIDKTIQKLLLSKDLSWSFQKEYRIIKTNKEKDKKKEIEKNKVKCKINTIYLGCKFPKKKLDSFIDKYKDKYVIKIMQLDSINQRIEFRVINPQKLLEDYRQKLMHSKG